MKKTNKKGFTIVELVIVIAVIAILAAVLIPTFSSIVDKANESSALQAVRNAYTECQVTLTGTSRTLADGTYFSDADGEYFFQLKNNSIEKASGKPNDADKDAYTVLENGVRLYGVDIDCEASTESGLNSSGTKIMIFKSLATSSTSISLTVYDSDGNEYYRESGNGTKIGFSMFNTKAAGTTAGVWANGAAVSDALKNCTESEDAEGWYSYTLTIDNVSHTGVFYYDGIEK